MKSFITFFLITFLGTTFAATTKEPLSLRTSTRSISSIRDALAAAGGCNVNLCFALDGSGSVTGSQFQRQQNFVADVLATIAGNPIEAAACQYGITASPISFLTSDVNEFLLDVFDAEFLGAPRTSIGAGIVWCSRQLNKNEDEARKIVVLGDGRNNFAGSPRRRADFFRRTGGKVCAIGIGFDRAIRRLERIAGDPSLVLRVRDYLELADILEECVEAVCEVTLQ